MKKTTVGIFAHVDAGKTTLCEVHECAVVRSVGTASCVDAGDPKLTELTLFLLAAFISIIAGLEHGLLGHLEMLALGTKVTLSELKDFFPSFARHHCAFYSCHYSLSSLFRCAIGQKSLEITHI